MEEVSQSETSLTGSVEDEKLPIEEVENQHAEEETTAKKSEKSPVIEEEVDNILEETKDDNVAEEEKCESPAAVSSEQKDEREEADVVEEDDVIQEADEVEEADVVEEIKETEKDDEASQEQPNEEEPNPKTPDQREQPTEETVDREVSPSPEESNNTPDEAVVEEKEPEKDDLHVSKADDEEKSGDAEDHDATTFEEVDANVSAEKSADESDMLGESDMTCPEKEAEKRGANNPVTPMEVDSLSNDDVEMVSGDGESEEKDKEDQVDEDPDHDKESPSQSASKSPAKDAAEEDERMDDDIEENPETASIIPRGEDVVDDGKDDKEPGESIEISEHAADDEDDDVHEAAEKTSTNKEVHAEEDEEEEANKEAVEKDGEDEMQDDNDVEMIEDDNNSNESPASREDDADPEGSHVENVQEPEESDVCLIPDTETEVTDAEKEKAIQARENAEKENEAAEAAAEAEAAALAKEGEEGASSAENQAETAQEGIPQEQEQEHEQEQEPLLEEMQPPGPVDGGTVQKIIIFHAVSQEKTCAHCKEEKTCGFRYKDAELGKTQYICKTGCIDALMTGNPGRYFIRRKKFLVEEVPESAADSNSTEHDCLQCKKTVSKNKYFFKQEDETFYICSEDCYKVLSSEEPEKFNLKRDSIRVRNIGHTTISSSKGSSSDSRLVSRSSQEAEAAKVERTKSFQRICTECKTDVQIRINGKNLIWQTMDFCDEQCLGKYQRRIGSHCQTCKGEVPHQSLGKYCVRFGFEVRQFCCAACLNNFKKGLKTCSCCQKDISVSGEGFLAPVGDKEQFKDFCSQACMRRYDSMVNAKKKLRTDRCGVCNFEKLMRVEMTIDGNEHNFCSNPCFSAFKFVSNIVPDQCGMCSKYFERKSNDCFTIYGDKQRPKVFCSRICFNVYIIVNRQITSCQWCKVKKYDFDMIMKLVDSQNPLMMCSLNCLTLYGVSINAFSRAAVKCDNCSSCTTPQYHLTMSDGTMRNFCTYQCVMQFQSQFARVPLTLDSEAVATATHHVTPKVKTPASSAAGAAPFPTGLPKRVKLNAAQAKAAAATSPQKSQQPVMPVISNVASLASGQSERVTNSSSGIRRGASRGRGRGRKMTLERSVPPPSPPPSPTSAPSTRGRSSGSPAPAQPSALASGVKSTRGGRTSSRSTGTHTPTETTRSPSPIIQKEIETKIVTVPPYPPLVRNVQTSCCPKTEDVGINCRPRTAEIGIQTDEDYSTRVLIPVPVPIFVPQPMYMYSAPFPMPIPIPLPIPVPIFIPTTRNSSAGILKEIKKIQDKMPADPFEAELLMMAEMVADEKNESDSDSEEEMKPEPRMIEVEYQTPGQTTNNVVNMEAQNNSSFGEDVLQMALKMASGEYEEPGVDLESAMTANTITNPPPGMIHSAHVQEDSGMQIGHHMMMEQPQRGGRGRKRGAIASPVTPRNNRSPIKRQRLSVDNTPPQPPQPVLPVEKPDANMCLKFTFGVNAWKQWVMTKNADIEKSSIRRRLFKTELLQMTADELNYSLCLFVKEVRKPNGTEYAPDTIYYLVLGIQQYLYENGRIDNIFTDPYYERFTDCLDEVARKFSVLYNDSQYIVTRVEEEHLWECKQLGAHSPHVLLSTLMFFNTKHFNLTNVEEHMQLSFSHIMKHWKRSAQNTKSPGTRNVLLRFYPPQAGLDANPRKKKVYEQQENDENPLRCPVRLYEFYLSKCPESVKTRNDVFYLQPERSCVPDSPVWYSTQALSEDHLQKMLHRVKMVKEINIALLTS